MFHPQRHLHSLNFCFHPVQQEGSMDRERAFSCQRNERTLFHAGETRGFHGFIASDIQLFHHIDLHLSSVVPPLSTRTRTMRNERTLFHASETRGSMVSSRATFNFSSTLTSTLVLKFGTGGGSPGEGRQLAQRRRRLSCAVLRRRPQRKWKRKDKSTPHS